MKGYKILLSKNKEANLALLKYSNQKNAYGFINLSKGYIYPEVFSTIVEADECLDEQVKSGRIKGWYKSQMSTFLIMMNK